MASESCSDSDKVICDNQDGINDLSTFVLKRVINCNKICKMICLEGTFTDRNGAALLLLERKILTYDMVKKLISKNCVITKTPNSDTYECFPDAEFCGMKAMLIFPATERHIKKFEVYPFHLIHETPDLYRDVTLPYITGSSFDLQWVYNIFAHEAEQESIIYEDESPETGFVFIPDLKWNQKSTDNLYVLAIARPRGIKSLRDLKAEHLPLLRNIRDKGIDVIKEKYGLHRFQLRIYIHYQPSYYHLHVHFTNIDFKAPGIMGTKSHLLDTVINNLEMVSDYYQRAVLSFSVKETEKLFLLFKEKGLVTELPEKKVEADAKEKNEDKENLNKAVMMENESQEK